MTSSPHPSGPPAAPNVLILGAGGKMGLRITDNLRKAVDTGVAGGLGAIAVQFVAPDSYTITLAISLFLGMVVGGVGWLPGSIVGSAFIFVPNIAEGISKGLSGAVFGVLLFLVIFLVPHGARQVAIVAQQLIGKFKN